MSARFTSVVLPMTAVAALAAMAVSVVVSSPASPSTGEKCSTFEVFDPKTGICMPGLPPDIVAETTAPGGGLPVVDGIPCTGQNSYECIGLAEQGLGTGPTPSASSTLSENPGSSVAVTAPAVTPPA
ncbi:intersectin-EH binding protein Ibp1 [Mycobacterium sp. NBC_00419]|uniref:intersectin-EH binding protein Ibp1 n=1 Tax=Mycobacterium sp. NBC_00419 TaxID=2975989 RepID=UPI002E1C21AF